MRFFAKKFFLINSKLLTSGFEAFLVNILKKNYKLKRYNQKKNSLKKRKKGEGNSKLVRLEFT